MKSPDTHILMESLTRTVNEEDEAVRLFATNFDVDLHNYFCLDEEDDRLFNYKSEDTGDNKLLHNSPAPRVLTLKVGCPVILIKNISATLVNGIKGEVVTLTREGPVVKFGGLLLKSYGQVQF